MSRRALFMSSGRGYLSIGSLSCNRRGTVGVSVLLEHRSPLNYPVRLACRIARLPEFLPFSLLAYRRSLQ